MAAGPDGSVVVAGTTFRRFDFGGTMVGQDISPVNDGATPSAFVVRLAADGEVEWARDLPGRIRLYDLAVGREGTIDVSGQPAGGRAFVLYQLHPDGSDGWTRALDAEGDVSPQALAASPTGDLAVAGDHYAPFTLDDEEFADPGASADVFLVRFDRATGAVEGGRRQSVSGLVIIAGMAIDNHGNVAVGGRFAGDLIIGGVRHSSHQTYAGWVGFFSPAFGSVHWSRSYRGDTDGEYVWLDDVTVTSNSRVMAAGHFDGSIDFGGRTRTGERAAILLRHLP